MRDPKKVYIALYDPSKAGMAFWLRDVVQGADGSADQFSKGATTYNVGRDDAEFADLRRSFTQAHDSFPSAAIDQIIGTVIHHIKANGPMTELIIEGHGGEPNTMYLNDEPFDTQKLLSKLTSELSRNGFDYPSRVVFAGCDVFFDLDKESENFYLNISRRTGMEIVGPINKIAAGMFDATARFFKFTPEGNVERDQLYENFMVWVPYGFIFPDGSDWTEKYDLDGKKETKPALSRQALAKNEADDRYAHQYMPQKTTASPATTAVSSTFNPASDIYSLSAVIAPRHVNPQMNQELRDAAMSRVIEGLSQVPLPYVKGAMIGILQSELGLASTGDWNPQTNRAVAVLIAEVQTTKAYKEAVQEIYGPMEDATPDLTPEKATFIAMEKLNISVPIVASLAILNLDQNNLYSVPSDPMSVIAEAERNGLTLSEPAASSLTTVKAPPIKPR